MNKTTFMKVALSFIGATLFVSCTDFYMDIPASELYTRSFIKEFGIVDSEQDWNMATEGTVTLALGQELVDNVKIYGEYGNKYYLVADLDRIKGDVVVPFDIPEGCDNVMVMINGAKYYGSVGGSIDCTDHPASRGISTDYGASSGTYSVTVGLTTRGNIENRPGDEETNTEAVTGVGATIGYDGDLDASYEYFNVQQLGPIVTTRKTSNDGDYFSLNSLTCRQFNGNEGILPEVGTENRTYAQEPTGAAASSFDKDFVYELGSAGKLTIFPYYYNSPKIHRLGIYLVDDNGNPLDADGKPVIINSESDLSRIAKYPVFLDKQNGDIQIAPKRPTGLADNAGSIEFVVKDGTKYPATLNGTTLTIMKGATIDLNDFVQLKVNGTEVVLSQYTSRFSFHAFNSGTYYEVDRDGILTANSTGLPDNTGADKVAVGIDNASDGYNNLLHNQNYDDTNDSKGMRKLTIKIVDGNPNTNWQREPSPIRTIEVGGLQAITQDYLCEIEVYQGETKRLPITLKDENGQTLDFDTYKGYLATDNWTNGNMFTFTVDESTHELVITGVGSVDVEGTATWDAWAHLYSDEKGDGYQETNSIDPEQAVHVWVKENKTHTYTTTINGTTWPTGLTPGWSSYFYSENGGSQISPRTTDTFSKPRRSMEASMSNNVWNGEVNVGNWGDGDRNTLHLNISSVTLEVGGKFRIGEITKSDTYPENSDQGGKYVLQVFYLDGGNWKQITSVDNPGSTLDIELDQTTINNLNIEKTLIISGYYTTFKSVTYIPAQTEPLQDGDWLADGQANAITALTNYYRDNYTFSGTCTAHDGCTVTLSTDDADTKTVEVNIPNDADKDNCLYTVKITLSKKDYTAPANAPRPYTARKNSRKSNRNAAGSRVQEFPTSRPDFLKYANTDGWMEPNKVWDAKLPVGDEGASFPTDQPLLARSRGYDIVVTVGGQPYTGHIGFYIDTWKNETAIGSSDGGYDHWSGKWSDNPTPNLQNPTHTFFSQRSLNKFYMDGHEWNYSYACRFKHPLSDREFMAFEDWEITHPAADDIATDGTPGTNYSSSDYSSDRDFNDLLYVVKTYTAKPKNENLLKSVENKGFTWIWALEDLGSTDDFDFNDVVMRITSITTTTSNTVEGGDGGSGTPTTTIVKNVKFTPLAAGGTLPIYIHFKYDETHDFILSPGTYDISTDDKLTAATGENANQLSTVNGTEYHQWFGNYASKVMINTGSGPSVNSGIQSCELLVPSTWKFNDANLPMADSGMGNSYYTMDAKGAMFYVTVNEPTAKTTQENIDNQWSVVDGNVAYAVGLPSQKGVAAQSFLIVEQFMYDFKETTNGESSGSSNQNKNYANPWYWPQERVHILEAYPAFNDWVKNSSRIEWYDIHKSTVNTSKLYGYPQNGN